MYIVEVCVYVYEYVFLTNTKLAFSSLISHD